LLPVSTTPAVSVAKIFAAGVIDMGGKFATTVIDTGGIQEKNEFMKKKPEAKIS
jgi:hypothetical protein